MSHRDPATYRSFPGDVITARRLDDGEEITAAHPCEVHVVTSTFEERVASRVRVGPRRIWVNGIEVHADTVRIMRHVEWYESDEAFRRWMEERW